MPMLAPPLPRMKPMLSQQPQQQAPAPPAPPPEPFVWGSSGERMTPADIAKRKQIAQAMMQEGSSYAPVQHWTQGLARVAQALAGGLEQRRADDAETEGRAHYDERFGKLQEAMNAPGADKNALLAQALAAGRDPYADDMSKAWLSQQVMQPQKTDDMKEFDWAKANGYQGTPMQYMQALKTPAFNPGQGYAIAPDSTPEHVKVYRPEGLPPDPLADGKPPPAGSMSHLVDAGGIAQQARYFNDTFKDSYAGRGENLIGGETANWLQSDTPGVASFITDWTGLDTGDPESADFWRQYQTFKNDVRHGKFGGALQPNEQAQFEKETISPNMDPARVRAGLASQMRVINGAVERWRGGLVNSGYNRKGVESALGFDINGDPTQSQQSAPAQSGPQSGTSQPVQWIRGPDGRLVRQ